MRRRKEDQAKKTETKMIEGDECGDGDDDVDGGRGESIEKNRRKGRK